ncbi:MAG TPA: chromate transporter [Terriglobales bacterium]
MNSSSVSHSNPSRVENTATQFGLLELALYFLRLGTFGFGGPIALVGRMQKDLVEERQWFSQQDYLQGVAFCQLSPGPLAAQLAIYLGWLRYGVFGGTLTGISFILPSFLMVLVLAGFYVRFGSLTWIQGAFYGIGAAVIGIIARSAVTLVRATIGRDHILWAVFLAMAVTTAWKQSEIIWLFLVCGVIVILLKAAPRRDRTVSASFAIPSFSALTTGAYGTAALGIVGALFLFFVKAGAFVFGSGLAIVPFLYGGVVTRYHWLTERQFVDAVAVAMITPGPIVITSGFIGYLVAGFLGAIAAAFAVFAPPYFFVLIGAPYYRRFADVRQVKAFVQGVTAAAVGAIAGATYVLARRSLVDLPTMLIAVVMFAVLIWTKKIPEPVSIVVAGAIGMFLKGNLR